VGLEKSNFITNLITLFAKIKGPMVTFIYFVNLLTNLFTAILAKIKRLTEVYEDLSKLPALNDINPCKQTLIIFDDMVTDLKKHPIIIEYFIRGRKK
jgi:hypothetical protein